MRVVKLHRYGVRTYPLGDGKLALEAPGKPRLEIAKPLEVTNKIWGPQELLTGSLASCFELTALAIARRRGVPIHAIRTDATGHAQSKDGVSRFVVFDLDVDIETDEGCEAAAECVASRAHEESLVARTLGVPIRLTVEARAAERKLAAA
jgi:organic hydroperoxide reductase OsmC/OhrA